MDCAGERGSVIYCLGTEMSVL